VAVIVTIREIDREIFARIEIMMDRTCGEYKATVPAIWMD